MSTRLMFFRSSFAVAVITLFLSGPGPAKAGESEVRAAAGTEFYPNDTCRSCHEGACVEYAGSMHGQSFANPVFLAQYTREVLPYAGRNVDGYRDARSCTSCHAPVAHKLGRARVVVPDPATAEASGVTCDFCHTIIGYRAAAPCNANYIVKPGAVKYGPFHTRTDWHHTYSQLQTRSEFCGICHNVRNRFGLDVKSTYAEWQESDYAAEGIQCQDCHMSVGGFLTNGRPVHNSGAAAATSLVSPPQRATLYTHRFQGARSRSQIEGAIQLSFGPLESVTFSDEGLELSLLVDNSRTGHKMPSGSIELRFLWLDVYAELDGRRIELTPMAHEGSSGLAVTGGDNEFDRNILGVSTPPGRRIYRAILADDQGQTTFASHLAQKKVFDNRLNAGEVRSEAYQLSWHGKCPPSSIVVCAKMYYVAYPDVFAERLGLEKAEPVLIASIEKTLSREAPAKAVENERPKLAGALTLFQHR